MPRTSSFAQGSCTKGSPKKKPGSLTHSHAGSVDYWQGAKIQVPKESWMASDVSPQHLKALKLQGLSGTWVDRSLDGRCLEATVTCLATTNWPSFLFFSFFWQLSLNQGMRQIYTVQLLTPGRTSLLRVLIARQKQYVHTHVRSRIRRTWQCLSFLLTYGERETFSFSFQRHVMWRAFQKNTFMFMQRQWVPIFRSFESQKEAFSQWTGKEQKVGKMRFLFLSAPPFHLSRWQCCRMGMCQDKRETCKNLNRQFCILRQAGFTWVLLNRGVDEHLRLRSFG